MSSLRSQALKLLRWFKPAEETCIKHKKIHIEYKFKSWSNGGAGEIPRFTSATKEKFPAWTVSALTKHKLLTNLFRKK